VSVPTGDSDENPYNFSIQGTGTDTALKLWLKLNETSGTNADDTSGNNLDGTLTNGPVWSGSALSFDGSNDVVTLGNPSALQITGAMTLSAWVNIDTFNNGRIIAKQGGSTDRGWSLNVESGSYAAMQISDSSNVIIYANSATLSTGVWVHLVGVYEPGSAVRIYVNGSQSGSDTTGIPASQRNSSQNVNVGRRPDSASNTWFDGLIDDVRVYNRALSAAEATVMFNNGRQ